MANSTRNLSPDDIDLLWRFIDQIDRTTPADEDVRQLAASVALRSQIERAAEQWREDAFDADEVWSVEAGTGAFLHTETIAHGEKRLPLPDLIGDAFEEPYFSLTFLRVGSSHAASVTLPPLALPEADEDTFELTLISAGHAMRKRLKPGGMTQIGRVEGTECQIRLDWQVAEETQEVEPGEAVTSAAPDTPTARLAEYEKVISKFRQGIAAESAAHARVGSFSAAMHESGSKLSGRTIERNLELPIPDDLRDVFVPDAHFRLFLQQKDASDTKPRLELYIPECIVEEAKRGVFRVTIVRTSSKGKLKGELSYSVKPDGRRQLGAVDNYATGEQWELRISWSPKEE